MAPSAFVLMDGLPLGPNGKVERRALPEPGTIRSAQRQFVPPRDELEAELAALWEQVLNVRPIGVTENYFDLGGNSLSAVRLVTQLRERFGRELPLAALFQGPTIEKLAELLRVHGVSAASQVSGPACEARGATLGSTWSPLVPIQPAGSRPPLFCVHPGGGNVLAYAPLARHLGSDQPFYAFQAPGLEVGQQPLDSVEQMSACYLAALRQAQPQGPYRLAGHSFGGLVAYEMARQLREQGYAVSLLALLDTPAPQFVVPPSDGGGQNDSTIASPPEGGTTKGVSSDDDVRFLVDLADVLSRYLKRDLTLDAAKLRTLAFDEQLAHVLQRLQAAGVAPPGMDVELLRRLLEVQKGIQRARRVYRPARYDGPITLLRAQETLRQIEQGAVDGDPALGWASLARGGLEVVDVPGDHIGMLTEPHVCRVAAALQRCLR
jgi:thioesterase domain-containing protein/acyl carrier protein